jgi:ArsR family transcriptional regulator
MKDFTRAAKALSDETRLRILNLVYEHECCVCEVMQALDISQTRASRNLKILYDAGFLKMRSDGLYTRYSLDGDNGNFYQELVSAMRQGLNGNATAKKDLERLRKAKRVGPGCVKTEREKKCPTC